MSEYLRLDNQLCFPLYALSRRITNIYRPMLDQLGLTYPQYLVMMVLWEEKTCNIKHLGDRLWLDTGTLTPLIKRMEQMGLLEKERSDEDERVANITLTEKGKLLEKQAEFIPEQIKCKIQMGDEEIASLRNYLKSILLTSSENK